ncbi:MAG: DUF2948 family protein, partial [Pseudomonadota bacterium]
ANAAGFCHRAKRRQFSIELNRFRWEDVSGRDVEPTRTRAILGIDGVNSVRARGVSKSDPELILSILTIAFEPGETEPAGTVRLTFAGDGEIALAVECLDITLLDSDTVWATKSVPDHTHRGGR